MYDYVTDVGMVENGYKPQYVMTNQVFICPRCSKKITTGTYLKPYFWRKAVIDHMLFVHNEKVEDEHA